MARQKKKKYNIIHSQMYIRPGIWNNYVFETFNGTESAVKNRIKELNNKISPLRKSTEKFSYQEVK